MIHIWHGMKILLTFWDFSDAPHPQHPWTARHWYIIHYVDGIYIYILCRWKISHLQPNNITLSAQSRDKRCYLVWSVSSTPKKHSPFVYALEIWKQFIIFSVLFTGDRQIDPRPRSQKFFSDTSFFPILLHYEIYH